MIGNISVDRTQNDEDDSPRRAVAPDPNQIVQGSADDLPTLHIKIDDKARGSLIDRKLSNPTQ